MPDWKIPKDLHYNWFDCVASIDCPCGEKELSLNAEDGEPWTTCPKCGRIYRLSAYVEYQEPEHVEEDDPNKGIPHPPYL